MADVKISALPLASTPLAGTEVLPIVQSATTDQVSVANLTAGRAVSAASLTLTTTPLAVGSGGTGLTSLTANYIPYGAGTSAFASTSTFVFDGSRLGIGTSSPSTYSGLLNVKTSDRAVIGYFGGTTYATRFGANTNFATIEGVDAATGQSSYQPLAVNGSILSLQTGGGERMRITAAGNVGIGTATPSVNLAINSAANTTGTANTFRLFDDGSAATSTTSNSFGFGFNAATGQLSYTTGVAGLHVFYTTNTERMRIAANGFVGIGTASPTDKLTLASSGADVKMQITDGTVIAWPAYVSNGTATYINGTYSNHPFLFYVNNLERARIDTSGNVVINTAAIATTATDGFLYVPTCAGTPTGTPTTYTGRAPIVVNTTNNKLYFYSGGAWRDAGP